MRRFVALFLTLGLVACGNQSKIQDAVRKKLSDPDSTKFSDWIVSKSLTYACIGWNSKNRMGGYDGWEVAELKKEGATWIVTELHSTERRCTQEVLNQRDSEKSEPTYPGTNK